MRPICIDGDGALLHSDLVSECLVEALRRHPMVVFLLPVWAFRGAAYVKQQLAVHSQLDVTSLPYDRSVLDRFGKQAEGGAPLELVTAADESIAVQIASHLGIFRGVVASTASANLSSRDKSSALSRKFGATGYDYVQERRRADPAQLLHLLRPYQWLKNALVFLPFLLAHHIRQPQKWGAGLIAFFAFSLCSSASYVVNDILDRYQDRLHPRRRCRPIAACTVSLRWAMALPVPLLALAGLCCMFLPWECGAVLLWYVGTTLFYSAIAKERLMADVIILALLYTSRIFMGSLATGNIVSPWLASFSLAMFLSLALCKRVSELITWRKINQENALGRKYEADDIPVLEMMAVSSGFLACLIMGLYIQSSEILLLYRHAHFLWVGVVALLYWIGRLVIWTHRGKCPDDPLFFVIQDRTTFAVVIIASIFGLLAI